MELAKPDENTKKVQEIRCGFTQLSNDESGEEGEGGTVDEMWYPLDGGLALALREHVRFKQLSIDESGKYGRSTIGEQLVSIGWWLCGVR